MDPLSIVSLFVGYSRDPVNRDQSSYLGIFANSPTPGLEYICIKFGHRSLATKGYRRQNSPNQIGWSPFANTPFPESCWALRDWRNFNNLIFDLKTYNSQTI